MPQLPHGSRVDATREGFREAAFMHDVCVKAIPASRKRRQAGLEGRRIDGQRMEGREGVEARILYQEQMHQVTVVGNERRPLVLRLAPSRVVDRESKQRPTPTAALGGADVNGAVEPRSIRGVDGG